MEKCEVYSSVKLDIYNVINDKLSFESKYIYDTAIQFIEREKHETLTNS